MIGSEGWSAQAATLQGLPRLRRERPDWEFASAYCHGEAWWSATSPSRVRLFVDDRAAV